jgi:hypothetical protein
MRHVYPLLMIITVAGCAAPGQPTVLTADQEKSVQVAVTAQLRDPDSARFGPISGARYDNGKILVCGVVNARNGYGGYAGLAPFIGHFDSGRSTFMVGEIGTPDGYGVAMIRQCRSNGVPI